MNIPATFEVACLVARARFGAQEADRVAEIVRAGDFDWSAFFALVARHYVVPLAQRNLTRIGGDTVPAKVLETLRVRSRLNAWKASRFATELVRLNRLFEAHSIETIHYKGAVAAEQYYGAIPLRTFGDLDFLVRRSDVERMVRLLEAEGYANPGEAFTPAQFEHFVAEFKEFMFTRGDLALEPHWSLAGRRYPFEVPYEGFWQRAQTLRFGDTDVRVLGPEDAVLVLCLVGAKGRWKRLQMVCDVAECVHTFPDVDWTSIVRTAKATGTYRILLLGLRLAKDLSGATVPEALATDLMATPIERLANDVVTAMVNPPVERRFLPGGPGVFSPLLFRQRERFRDRWLYLWRTTTTPSPMHMERMPLPALLSPLYRILVPLHDYVVIPIARYIKDERSEEEAGDEPRMQVARLHEKPQGRTDRPKQRATAAVQRIGDEMMVLDTNTDVLHNLNVTAAWIFHQCNGETDVSEIVDGMMEKFSVDREVAERDVVGTLRELKARGLVSSGD